MSSGSGTATVSRREYIRSQWVTWLYIVILVSRLTAKSAEWPDVLLLLGALIQLLYLFIRILRER
jgi:hypothetical protein